MNNNKSFEPAAELTEGMGAVLVSLAVLCLVIMTPFVINNFLQGRPVIGAMAFLVTIVFNINAWSIYRYKRHFPNLIMLGAVPPVLVFVVFSLRTQGVIGAFWCYPAILAFYFMLPERRAWLANVALLSLATPVIWIYIEHDLALRIITTLTMVSMFSAIFINVINKQKKQLHMLAVTDPLTGVLNRTLLHESLELAIQQFNRSSAAMTLVMIDLDDFKSINDELGHDAGDLVLQAVGNLFQKRCRSVDKVFRLGGEEFLLLLYNTGNEGARHIAEELRAAIEVQLALPNRVITASVGIASLQEKENWSVWMKRADSKLYAAKQGGRNCVVA